MLGRHRAGKLNVAEETQDARPGIHLKADNALIETSSGAPAPKLSLGFGQDRDSYEEQGTVSMGHESAWQTLVHGARADGRTATGTVYLRAEPVGPEEGS